MNRDVIAARFIRRCEDALRQNAFATTNDRWVGRIEDSERMAGGDRDM
jgi:hypothetical protein